MSEVAPPVSPAWPQRPVLDLGAAALHPVSAVLQELGSTQAGLTSDEAAGRLATVGRNVLASRKVTALGVLGRQLRNPLLILLLAAAGVSAATGDPTDGAIIAAIVAARLVPSGQAQSNPGCRPVTHPTMIMRSFVRSRLRNARRRAGDRILFWFHLPLALLVALNGLRRGRLPES